METSNDVRGVVRVERAGRRERKPEAALLPLSQAAFGGAARRCRLLSPSPISKAVWHRYPSQRSLYPCCTLPRTPYSLPWRSVVLPPFLGGIACRRGRARTRRGSRESRRVEQVIAVILESLYRPLFARGGSSEELTREMGLLRPRPRSPLQAERVAAPAAKPRLVKGRASII